MKIKDLDIRDVGIIQGEKLENIGQGIVVIGGLNRAGKTTFMEVIRRLGYGFNKGDKIAPPKFEYDVRSKVITEENKNYNILLKGYAPPNIKEENNESSISSYELYKNLDSYTYKQLFTISLDELKKLSGKDNSGIQSILLGAGFKEVAKIPYITKEFRNERNKLGGERGAPSVKMFKVYNSKIKEGIKLKNIAAKEIKEYENKKQELLVTSELLKKEKETLSLLDCNITILDVIKNNYHLYRNMIEIESIIKRYDYIEGSSYKDLDTIGEELYSEYKKVLEEYNTKLLMFNNEVSSNNKYISLLLSKRNDIESYYSGISGMKEKIKVLEEYRERLRDKKLSIYSRIKMINENWSNFEEITTISCDEIKYRELLDNITKYNELKEKKRDCEKELEALINESTLLRETIDNLGSIKEEKYIKYYTIINVAIIFLGIGIAYINKIMGAAFIIMGSIATGLFLFIKHNTNSINVSKYKEYKIKFKVLEKSISLIEEKKKSLLINIAQYDYVFDAYRENIKLEYDVSVDGIKEFYKYLLDIKRELREYDTDRKGLQDKEMSFSSSIDDIEEFLNSFHNISQHLDLKYSEDYNKLFVSIGGLYKALHYAEEVKLSSDRLKVLEERIKNTFKLEEHSKEYLSTIKLYIEKGKEYRKYTDLKEEYMNLKEKVLQPFKTERVEISLRRWIKNKICQEDNISIADSDEYIFEHIFNEYTSLENVSAEFTTFLRLKSEREKSINELIEKSQRLKYDIEQLSTDETLMKSSVLINEGRNRLRPLAEKYALYSTINFLLEKIQKRFIDNTKDSLLAESQRYLSKITGGELIEIEPIDDLIDLDFKTRGEDGKTYSASNMLSRGSEEQLYLSVRMGRIKDIVLPVVFDDSFVNFDLKHIKEVVSILKDLSKTHQIFILTCHPYLIKYIAEVSKEVQYWKLDKGRFTLSTSEELEKYLKV